MATMIPETIPPGAPPSERLAFRLLRDDPAADGWGVINVYRAFRREDMQYPYFAKLLPHFYRSRDSATSHGLKVWPEGSPLVEMAEAARFLQ